MDNAFDAGKQQVGYEVEGGEEDSLVSGRLVAAVEFRVQRKEAVARSRRAAASQMDALRGTSGGWSP